MRPQPRPTREGRGSANAANPGGTSPPTKDARTRIDAALLTLARHRAPDATTCPSDTARAIGGDNWRSLMPAVRERLRVLATRGELEVTQRGLRLDPAAEWRGPVRVRLKS